MILGIYNPAGLVTFSGLVLSLTACILSFNSLFEPAVVCFIFAGLCDLFDGPVARRTNTTAMEKEFGFHLDSLVDVVSFGVTPGIILLHSGFNRTPDHLLIIFFCCCAVMRLAFFNATKKDHGADISFFTGLPVTYSALLLPLVFTLGSFATPAIFTAMVRLTLLLVGLLYILRIRVPKPGGVFYLVFLVLGVLLALFWTLKTVAVIP
jgi:CDP-diacylglycerol--serine O-phosphatidyltransferase